MVNGIDNGSVSENIFFSKNDFVFFFQHIISFRNANHPLSVWRKVFLIRSDGSY
jgi:hypothetical protein